MLSRFPLLVQRPSSGFGLLGALLVACGGPEPNPSDEASPFDDSDIESVDAPGSEAGPRETTFRMRWSGESPEGPLRVMNLDSDAAALSVEIDTEGVAEFGVAATDGDEIRLQLVSSAGRGEPVDFVLRRVDGFNTLERVRRHACLGLEPGFEVGFDLRLAQVGVYNDCSDILTLAEPRLRAGELGSTFELVTLMPVELGVGLSAGIDLRTTESAERPAEDVLFFEAEVDSERFRYAIGLYAPP